MRSARVPALPADRFPEALAVTLRFEGGWYPGTLAGDPNPTMQGITQRTYDGWRAAQGLAPQSVQGIAPAEVEAIYRGRFWDRAGCPAEAWPLALLLFDWAVNSGTGIAVPRLAVAARDPARYQTLRWAFLDGLMVRRPATAVFRRGWARRVNTLCTAAGVPLVAPRG